MNLENIHIFEHKKVRTIWDEEKQDWFFSIVDVCAVLTEQDDYNLAKNYWKVLKHRLIKEGNESVTKCNQLKLESPKDGKRYATDVADLTLMFRIIESIPSKKAEPFKAWMASIAAERINQMIDPERSIDQAMADYRRLGYSESWITRRIKTIEIRKGLTDEWKRGGVTKEVDFAFLTDLMSKTWSGLTTREYKKHKGLTEETATEISKERNPNGLSENARIAKEGADVAKAARTDVEKRLGKSVISSQKAVDYILSPEELPFEKQDDQ
ncbi:MAG: hypothetical protein IJ314_02680 [Bacteroidales bacterium]|nr:hypothetical protein [Bacteroidales bacterium]